MLLEMKDVSKRLGKFELKNISLELPEGYIMGLIGRNGAGKTSLIHVILGLYHTDKGKVIIDNQTYEDNEQEIREKLGTVLLEDMFDESLTLESNGDRYGRYYKNYNKEVFLSYLNRFNLQPNKKFGKLSKGEKLKFQFAFAISHNAKLLVLDEPTGNFDPSFRKEFFAIIKEFIADGKRSVVISTHLTDDLDRIADYICYLQDGEVIFAGDIESLREKYKIVSGELYKINLLNQQDIIYVEKGQITNRALVCSKGDELYDALLVSTPTIEELMYFMSKRGEK